MAREEYPNPRFSGCIENLKNSIYDLLAILDLTQDSDLHVVDD
jgi:hypothetical protein